MNKSYKELPLTKGKVALVDAEDFDYLSKFSWHCSFKKKNNCYYGARSFHSNGKQHIHYLHREIMRLMPGDKRMVDHCNGDGLDNRKFNLRICSKSCNMRNPRKLRKDNKSGFYGVWWCKRDKRWISQIKFNNKRICVGYFLNKTQAALARDKAVLKHHGEFAKFNFPELIYWGCAL